MKPKVFIGSSVESLNIAYSIQENLEHDGNITVWAQGIFKLSSNILSDLLEALTNFDFAIFVFQPNDFTEIRNSQYQTVRDNVIFEMGLFIGRLGKDRVFYIIPRNSTNLHLPSDLIGLSPGYFDSQREDNNLAAALGPFCNQVRIQLKSYIIENLTDLKDETVKAKRIAIDKTDYWEFELAIELLNTKLSPINQSYYELDNELVVQRINNINYKELYIFVRSSLATYKSFSEQFLKCLDELKHSFGPPGISGNTLEIKKAVDHIILICKELLAWEYELNSLNPPEDLKVVKRLMKGWSKVFINAINGIAPQIHIMITQAKAGIKPKPIVLNLEAPEGMSKIVEPFRLYLIKHNITEPLL